MFSDFAETLHTFSTPKVISFILGIKLENFLMGLKIDFKFEISALVIRIFFEINFSNLARAAVSSPALVTSGVPAEPCSATDFILIIK